MEIKNEKICLFVRMLGIYYVSLIFGAMNIGSIGSLLKIIGFIPILIWFIDKTAIYKSRLLTFFFLSVIWTGMACLWTIDPSGSKQRLFTQASFLLLLISVASYIYSKEEIAYLKSCLIWSSRISAVCTLLFADYHEGRVYLNGVLKEDPNYLCAYFLFGIIYGLEILFNDEVAFKLKIRYALEELMYFYIILATGSRGGLLAVIGACGIFFLFRQKKWRISPKTMITGIAVIIMLFVMYYIAIRFVPAEVMNRFMPGTVAKSNGTGRFTIWEDTIGVYRYSSLFRQLCGYGPGAAFTIARTFGYRVVNVVHNIFLEHLIELGIVGLVLYCVYIFRFWNCARMQKNIFAFSIMNGLIVLSLSTSIQTFKPYWNILLFIIVSEYTTESVLKQEKSEGNYE